MQRKRNTLPCPKCRENGKDRRGDNLHVYPDGSSYCFACGYHSNRTKLVKREETDRTECVLPRDSGVFPNAFTEWWDRYLLGEDIRKWAYYSGQVERLVFPLPSGWVGRSLDSEPKWLQEGNKYPLFLGTGNMLVVCEDIISGIKLSNICCSCVLFGTAIDILNKDSLKMFKAKDVVVWLDSDMKKKMLKTSSILSLSGIKSRIIYSDRDIKEYSYKDIALFLTERI